MGAATRDSASAARGMSKKQINMRARAARLTAGEGEQGRQHEQQQVRHEKCHFAAPHMQHSDLDAQIAKLLRCELIAEAQVESLCNKARCAGAQLACAQPFAQRDSDAGEQRAARRLARHGKHRAHL